VDVDGGSENPAVAEFCDRSRENLVRGAVAPVVMPVVARPAVKGILVNDQGSVDPVLHHHEPVNLGKPERRGGSIHGSDVRYPSGRQVVDVDDPRETEHDPVGVV
jgi:hypothetical protein